MKRFTPWPNTVDARGSQMGRLGCRLDLEGVTVNELAVAGPAGEYDAGGAYWGYSQTEGPVRVTA